ncbi:MAG: hypothetical protein O2809_00855 [Proteobacteria bacterium]|nr:hypothetical protein [Pseudomonadota bacterium]
MFYKNFKRPYKGSLRDNFACYMLLATAFYGIVYFFTTQGKLIPLSDAKATQVVLIVMYGLLWLRALLAFINPSRHNMIFYYAPVARGHYVFRCLAFIAVLGYLALTVPALDNVVIYYLIAIKMLALVVPLRKEVVAIKLIEFYLTNAKYDAFRKKQDPIFSDGVTWCHIHNEWTMKP